MSTETFAGIGGRSSTRVRAAPGGQSSIIFGDAATPATSSATKMVWNKKTASWVAVAVTPAAPEAVVEAPAAPAPPTATEEAVEQATAALAALPAAADTIEVVGEEGAVGSTSLADLMAARAAPGPKVDENEAPAEAPAGVAPVPTAPGGSSLADLVTGKGAKSVIKPQHAPKERVSSNIFASGDSQNSGNTITDRSTTRVRAPPGGYSTFSLS